MSGLETLRNRPSFGVLQIWFGAAVRMYMGCLCVLLNYKCRHLVLAVNLSIFVFMFFRMNYSFDSCSAPAMYNTLLGAMI